MFFIYIFLFLDFIYFHFILFFYYIHDLQADEFPYHCYYLIIVRSDLLVSDCIGMLHGISNWNVYLIYECRFFPFHYVQKWYKSMVLSRGYCYQEHGVIKIIAAIKSRVLPSALCYSKVWCYLGHSVIKSMLISRA